MGDAMRKTLSHGGFFIAISPPGRGVGSSFGMAGREWHVGKFEDPRFSKLRVDIGLTSLILGQCMTRPDR